MKRSEINAIIDSSIEFAKSMNFLLPEFAYWTPEDFRSKGSEYDEIFHNMLGWDITDFGSGRFEDVGLVMLTLRNGNYSDERYVKPYAEKMLIVLEGQVTPYHYHSLKMEDIINRGGGNLIVKLYNSKSPKETLDTDVSVNMDGRTYTVPAGEEVRVRPGQSITLHTGVFHSFWAEKGCGKVLLGEVSRVNDDYTDNNFLSEVGRFPEIEEDVPAKYMLYSEYSALGRR